MVKREKHGDGEAKRYKTYGFSLMDGMFQDTIEGSYMTYLRGYFKESIENL